MRFKKSPQLPGAGRTRAWHHHGSHTPTSPEVILLSKMVCQPKHFGRQCIYFINSLAPLWHSLVLLNRQALGMSVYLHHLWLNKGNYLMYSIEHDEWIFYSRGNIEKKTRRDTLFFSMILTQKNKPILIVGWGVGAGYVDVITMTSSQILWCILLLNMKN